MAAPVFGSGFMEVNPLTSPVTPKNRAVSDQLTAINDPNFTSAFYSEVYRTPFKWQGGADEVQSFYNMAKAYAVISSGTTTPVANLSVTFSAGYAPILGYIGSAIQQSSVVVKNTALTTTYVLNTDYTLLLNGSTLLLVRVPTGAIPAGSTVSVSFNYYQVP